MLKVYILDDEQNAVDGLRAMLQKKFGERVRIVGSNIHPLKAIEELERQVGQVVNKQPSLFHPWMCRMPLTELKSR